MTGADLTAFAKKHPLGVTCLVIALASGVALYFRADAIGVSQTEYEAKSSEAAKMIANVKNAPGLEEQVAEMQELGKELDSRLVKAGQLAVNLQYFYKLEADHGVKFLDVRQTASTRTARPGAPKTIFTPVPFTLSVEGTYDQLVKFLGALQNGRHLCRINSAVLNKPNAAANSEASKLTLALNLELLGQP
jgi:Tfp pilus assembly protein PilO